MNRFIAEKVRADERDHVRVAAAVLAKIKDKRFSILEKLHCGRDRIGPRFVITEAAQIDVTNVAVHPLNTFESKIDATREPAVLFAFRLGRFAALCPGRNRLRRKSHAEMLVFADRLDVFSQLFGESLSGNDRIVFLAD